MTISDEEVYAYLEHHGIKGQKWGVRKQQTSNQPSKPGGWSNKKKVAFGLGAAGLAAGIAVGAIYAKKHFGVSTSALKDVSTGKKFADSIIEEPTGIMHSSRGIDKGFHFLQNGGLNNPLKELEKAGVGDETPVGSFKRYGKNAEKVYVSFKDPLGRKDAAGRVIPHGVHLPKHLAEGINTHEEAVNKAWPLIKDSFDEMYKSSKRKY